MALKILLSNYHRKTEIRGLAGWPSVAITALLSPKDRAEVTVISTVSPFSLPDQPRCAAAEQRRKGEERDVAKGPGGSRVQAAGYALLLSCHLRKLGNFLKKFGLPIV